jgi:hypothetical protein
MYTFRLTKSLAFTFRSHRHRLQRVVTKSTTLFAVLVLLAAAAAFNGLSLGSGLEVAMHASS